MLDGAPIIAVVTGLTARSANSKTGAMLQTFIIRADMHPQEALKSGADISICGGCAHRPTLSALGIVTRSCYVRMDAVASVYRSFSRGRYASTLEHDGLRELGEGRAVRLGSYGDPMAVPACVWQSLIALSASHTGYTHQWKAAAPKTRKAFQALCMASADCEDTRALAQAAGWRTFRVTGAGETQARTKTEVLCPASEEAGRKTTCSTCGLCSGSRTRANGLPVPSVYIPAHGNGKRYVPVQLAA
jgi:hypothetical protein